MLNFQLTRDILVETQPSDKNVKDESQSMLGRVWGEGTFINYEEFLKNTM